MKFVGGEHPAPQILAKLKVIYVSLKLNCESPFINTMLKLHVRSTWPTILVYNISILFYVLPLSVQVVLVHIVPDSIVHFSTDKFWRPKIKWTLLKLRLTLFFFSSDTLITSYLSLMNIWVKPNKKWVKPSERVVKCKWGEVKCR
jgi:hypothetical protein